MTSPSRRRVLRWAGSVVTAAGASSAVRSHAGRTLDSGAVRWRQTYGDSEFQCQAIRGADDGVMVVGRTGNGRSATVWIAEIGPDGVSRWTTTIDTPGFTQAVDVARVDSGYAVVGTTDGSPRLWVAFLDGDGEEQRRWTAETPRGVNALRPIDDGYLLCGYRGDRRLVDPDLRAWVREVDAEGRTRWERTYEGDYVRTVFPRDGGFLLAGGSDDDAWLCAVDADWEPIWHHTYGGVDTERVATAVPATNGVLYGGRSDSTPDLEAHGILVRTTADGEFAWRRTYDVDDVVDLCPVEGGYALTGEPRTEVGEGRDPEKPIHVVDRWGRVQETVTVSVDTGTPVGLTRLADGALIVGGWSSEDGIWLAKIEPEVAV